MSEGSASTTGCLGLAASSANLLLPCERQAVQSYSAARPRNRQQLDGSSHALHCVNAALRPRAGHPRRGGGEWAGREGGLGATSVSTPAQ
eukprot:233210-Chlamydomonas_euryale.AAC.5